MKWCREERDKRALKTSRQRDWDDSNGEEAGRGEREKRDGDRGETATER